MKNDFLGCKNRCGSQQGTGKLEARLSELEDKVANLATKEAVTEGEVVVPEPFNPAALQEEIEQLKVKNAELEQALNAEKAKVAVSDVVNEQTADGIKVTVAKTDSSSSDFIIPKVPVEIHFENATFENGKLKVALNDGTVKETDFTAEVLTQAINNAAPEQKSALGNAIKGLLVGEVVKDFADVVKGYLIKASI